MAQWGRISIWDAAADGNLERVKQKLANGIVAVDGQDANGKTPLMEAARWGYLHVVEYLKEQGADINKTNTEGATPLHIAAEGGHNNIVEYLLKHNANINARNNVGDTPIMNAAGRNHPETVKLLVERGADLKIQNGNRKTVFDLAPNDNVSNALTPPTYVSPTKY